jgi:hypothetical protein
MATKLVCTVCGNYDVPQQSFLGGKKICKKCGATQLVPADTPVGKRMLEAQNPSEPANVSNTTKSASDSDATKVQNKKVLKWMGIIVLAYLALVVWYISIPAVTIWYLYKKNKSLNTKLKLAISVIVSIVFLGLGASVIHSSRAPEISIQSPENNLTVQATSTVITGVVEPVNSIVLVNGVNVEVGEKGDFVYTAILVNESNSYNFEASNGGKKTSQAITINRMFTPEELVERERRQEEAKIASEENRVKEIKEKLQREVDSFDKPFDSSLYRDSVLSLTLEVALFNAWAEMVEQHKADKNPEVISLVKQLESKASALQVKEFPLIRKTYAEIMAKEMWTNNVEVESVGGSHKTIQLTAGMFANNANKAEAHQAIVESLKIFRFTQANYKWYEYDDKYTYFEIESPADGDLVVIKSN